MGYVNNRNRVQNRNIVNKDRENLGLLSVNDLIFRLNEIDARKLRCSNINLLEKLKTQETELRREYKKKVLQTREG